MQKVLFYTGLDLHHDKDGHTHGTWIAVSGKKRKIGSLINIMTNTRPDPHLKGRGLCTQFLVSPQECLFQALAGASQGLLIPTLIKE